MLSPYVRLASQLSIEKQNTPEERIRLDFEQEDYFILTSWDRLVFKGQGDIKRFTVNNSSIETPFLNILGKLSQLDGFGDVRNAFFGVTYLIDLGLTEDEVFETYHTKLLPDGFLQVLPEFNDFAISLEKKSDTEKHEVAFGPYLGRSELDRRIISPIDSSRLENVDFRGILLESKQYIKIEKADFRLFNKMVETASKAVKELCDITLYILNYKQNPTDEEILDENSIYSNLLDKTEFTVIAKNQSESIHEDSASLLSSTFNSHLYFTNEKWENTLNIQGNIVALNSEEVFIDCLVDIESKDFQTRSFPIYLFDGIKDKRAGTKVMIQTKTKPGSVRINIYAGKGMVDDKLFNQKANWETLEGSNLDQKLVE